MHIFALYFKSCIYLYILFVKSSFKHADRKIIIIVIQNIIPYTSLGILYCFLFFFLKKITIYLFLQAFQLSVLGIIPGHISNIKYNCFKKLILFCDSLNPSPLAIHTDRKCKADECELYSLKGVGTRLQSLLSLTACGLSQLVQNKFK